MKFLIGFGAALIAFAPSAAQLPKMLTVEHTVAVKSTLPALAGRTVDLFSASLEWLTKGTVNGSRSGVVRMGYTNSTAPLPPAHPVRGNTVRVDWPALSTINVQRGFRYAGGHRFILRNVADAEQHAFAEVDGSGNISRFYWFQFESLLPDRKGGYDYSKDAPLTLAGLQWRASVRRYTAPPEPDGDQAALYKLFAARGWRQPLPALRARIVHVPADDPRKELMIIYAEATTSSAPPTDKESADLIARAQAGLRLIR